MSRAHVKLYGERNTGTNYLSRLIALNLDVIEIPGVVPPRVMRLQERLPGEELVRDIYFALNWRRTLGWKHALMKPAHILERYARAFANPVVVTLTKNPYSWLVSLYRRPYHQQYPQGKPDFETFLRQPWKTVFRDNAPRRLSSPVELWNIKNAAYLTSARALPIVNLTFEALLADPAGIIDDLARRFGWSRLSPDFVNHEASTKESGKDSGFYSDYYARERWKDSLTPQAVALVNERVDQALMRHFGYERLG